MEGESKTKGLVQLKTNLRSLKYEDASPYTAPLNTRDINSDFVEKTAVQPRKVQGGFLQQYRQYFKNETSLLGAGVAAQGHSRIDDVIRIAKFMGTPKGLLWEMHQAALQTSQYNISEKNRVTQGSSVYSLGSTKSTEGSDKDEKIWQKIVGAVKKTAKNALKSIAGDIGLTAGTLTQTALNGTGYHHDTFISRAYLIKPGAKSSTVLETLGFGGSDKVNGGAAIAGGSRTVPSGSPAYSMIFDTESLGISADSLVSQNDSNFERPSIGAPRGIREYVSGVILPNFSDIESSASRELENFKVDFREAESNHLHSRKGISSKVLDLFVDTSGSQSSQTLRPARFLVGESTQVGTDGSWSSDTGNSNIYREVGEWSTGTGTVNALIGTSSIVDDKVVKGEQYRHSDLFVGVKGADLISGSYVTLVEKNKQDSEGKEHYGFGNSRLGILADLLNQSESVSNVTGNSLTVKSGKHDFLDRLGSDKDQAAGYSPAKYSFEKQLHSARVKDGTPQRIADSEGQSTFNGSVGKVLDVGTSTHTYKGYSYLNELDGKTGDRAWVRTRLDSGAESTGKIAGDERQKDQSKIPVTSNLDYQIQNDLSDKLSLIPFCLTTLTPDNRTYLNFEANLESYDDSYTGNWSGTQYIGRAEQFYNYTGFSRDISFAFKVVARKADDLKPLYQKLNILCSATAPSYDSGMYFMRGTLGSITIGDLVSNQVGYFKSVKVSWKTDYPWEIGNVHSSWRDQVGTEIIRVPHLLDVSVGFTPVHYFNTQVANTTDRDRIYFGKKY